ncbi:hypothetical protein [Pontibacter beigongshangensis]|uniref:hypothetical protein n=1 Tax=Pontibacter beigongshangensis TaxID=2574733 RepID=UPI00164FA483|nr:hypothetical protein [Pontibacter beigongshangensis]
MAISLVRKLNSPILKKCRHADTSVIYKRYDVRKQKLAAKLVNLSGINNQHYLWDLFINYLSSVFAAGGNAIASERLLFPEKFYFRLGRERLSAVQQQPQHQLEGLFDWNNLVVNCC